MSQEITLTQAEIELIRIKRETEALEKQKKEAENALRVQKRILAEQRRGEEFKINCGRKNGVIRDAYNKLNAKYPNLYELVQYEGLIELMVYDYNTETSEREYDFKETVFAPLFKIKRVGSAKNSSCEIVVTDECTLQFRDNYAMTGSWNRSYKNILSMHKIIEEKIAKANREKNAANAEVYTINKARKLLTERYPKATVEVRKEYNSPSRYASRSAQGYYTIEATILHANLRIVLIARPNMEDLDNPRFSTKSVSIINESKASALDFVDTLITI